MVVVQEGAEQFHVLDCPHEESCAHLGEAPAAGLMGLPLERFPWAFTCPSGPSYSPWLTSAPVWGVGLVGKEKILQLLVFVHI